MAGSNGRCWRERAAGGGLLRRPHDQHVAGQVIEHALGGAADHLAPAGRAREGAHHHHVRLLLARHVRQQVAGVAGELAGLRLPDAVPRSELGKLRAR